MAYSSVINGQGSTANRFTLSKANRNFTTQYFKSVHASGDIRIQYLHDRFTSTGGGEIIRAVAEAYATGSAAGATINAAHYTGRVGVGATISGALNALRTTLEIAGTNPSPGGTLAANQWDSNIVTGTTLPATTSMTRVSQSGAVKVPNLFQLPVPGAKTTAATDLFLARHADATATHGIAVVDDAGTRYWILVTTDTPGD